MEKRVEEIVNWLEYRIYRDKQSGLTNTTTMYQSIVNLIKDQQKEINKLKHKKEKIWIIYGMILSIYFCISAFLTKNIAWVSVAFMWLGFSVIEYFNDKTIKIKDLTIQEQEKFIQSMIQIIEQSMLSKGEIKKN